MSLRIVTVNISAELDVVNARQRARDVARLCGFGVQDQVRIATSVSELARNVFNYAGSGKVEFSVEEAGPSQVLQVRIEDHGPGVANLDLVLSGRYQSPTGMGLGILGAQRLMDRCEIDTAPGKGTTIVLQKDMPAEARRVTAQSLGELSATRGVTAAGAMLDELRQQNQELLGAMDELKIRQEELVQLTRELEDTNRGVVALYAELEEQAEQLRRADAMKSRFLSNMSHEFRTPLSSIRALAKLLLNRVDGDLTPEQERQVSFILQGSMALSDMVNDLLDLAKIEAGKVDVRPEKFEVGEMFGALRGMLRPLIEGSAQLRLTFEEAPEGMTMFTDEGKVSQILRNFISNSLKFTEQGEVAVRAEALPGSGSIRFSVSDTGLGIEPEHLQIIFEEFGQVESHLQARTKGTGLGLPLCRNLATLLNGSVSVESTPGKGSIFSTIIPVVYTEVHGVRPAPEPY
ncbi:MAG: ATP-binding protein [Telluria sp.]